MSAADAPFRSAASCAAVGPVDDPDVVDVEDDVPVEAVVVEPAGPCVVGEPEVDPEHPKSNRPRVHRAITAVARGFPGPTWESAPARQGGLDTGRNLFGSVLARLPPSDPGNPDLRSPVRFLFWLARMQRSTVAAGGVFGAVWMGAQGLIPAALGGAVNAIVDKHKGGLIAWSLVVFGLGVIQAVAGVLRHRRAVTNFLSAAVRVQQLVTRQAVRLGGDLPRHVDAGEVASLGTTDVQRIARILDVTARGTGAVFSYVVVAVILLFSSPAIGLVLVIGVPLGALAVMPVMRPLERRQTVEREKRSDASSIAADTVVGLRVLRGLGGEEEFSARYNAASQLVRRATVRTALAQAFLDSFQVLFPGAILVAVTYLGARFVVEGRISPGHLVAYYAYAAFLVLPIQTLMEAATRWSAATVAAGRVISVLSREPDLKSVDSDMAEPGPGEIADSASGLRIESGQLTAVVSPDPDEASDLAARLGRYADAAPGEWVSITGVRVNELPIELRMISSNRRRLIPCDLAIRLAVRVVSENSRSIQARAARTRQFISSPFMPRGCFGAPSS